MIFRGGGIRTPYPPLGSAHVLQNAVKHYGPRSDGCLREANTVNPDQTALKGAV